MKELMGEVRYYLRKRNRRKLRLAATAPVRVIPHGYLVGMINVARPTLASGAIAEQDDAEQIGSHGPRGNASK